MVKSSENEGFTVGNQWISSLSENVAMPCLYAVVGSNKTHSFTTFGMESDRLQSWHIPSGNQNIAMENHQFMVDFPIKHSIYSGFPVAMFDDTGG